MQAKTAPKLPVYLDNAASTPMDQRVIDAMVKCLSYEGIFGNSASKDHVYGWQAAEVIDNARDQIALAIGCSPLEIIFTSGATESNNFAIKGLARALNKAGDKRKTIITSSIEHKAVIESATALECEGFVVKLIRPRTDGTITPEMLDEAMDESVFLVSISQANSVLGSMNDINALAEVAHKYGALYHSDCAQSNALIPLDLDHSLVDMVTLTPEKIYGPKGIGALYLKRSSNIELDHLISGGGHEKGLRGGTPATHQIAAMGEAFAIMQKERTKVCEHLESLKNRLITGLKEIPGAHINGYMEGTDTPHLPGIVSVSFDKVEGKFLIPTIRGVAVSSGSACSSSVVKPSYILTETGHSDELAMASIRLSIGRFNTEEDIDTALKAIANAVNMLRKA